jgi:hypothetical protein
VWTLNIAPSAFYHGTTDLMNDFEPLPKPPALVAKSLAGFRHYRAIHARIGRKLFGRRLAAHRKERRKVDTSEAANQIRERAATPAFF